MDIIITGNFTEKISASQPVQESETFFLIARVNPMT